jgi:hypothetical protein
MEMWPPYFCPADLPWQKLDTNFVLHYYCAMKNVTITLDEKVAKWARIRAAELDTSVSRLLGDLLREKMLEERAYEAAMEKFLSVDPVKLKKPGAGYPRRDKLHAR